MLAAQLTHYSLRITTLRKCFLIIADVRTFRRARSFLKRSSKHCLLGLPNRKVWEKTQVQGIFHRCGYAHHAVAVDNLSVRTPLLLPHGHVGGTRRPLRHISQVVNAAKPANYVCSEGRERAPRYESVDPVRRTLLQKREHSLARLVGDEQLGRLPGQRLGLAVKCIQDRRRRQPLRRGQALRRALRDLGCQLRRRLR